MASSSVVSHQGRADGGILVSEVMMKDGKCIWGKRSLKFFATAALLKTCNVKMKGILHNVEGPRITRSNDILKVLDSGETNSAISCYRKRTMKINFHCFYYFACKEGCAAGSVQELQ